MLGLSAVGAARCGGTSLDASTAGGRSGVAVATCGGASFETWMTGGAGSDAAGALPFTDFGVVTSPFPALVGAEAFVRGRWLLRGRLGVVAALSTLGEAGVTFTAGALAWGRLPFRRPGRAEAGDGFATDGVVAVFAFVAVWAGAGVVVTLSSGFGAGAAAEAGAGPCPPLRAPPPAPPTAPPRLRDGPFRAPPRPLFTARVGAPRSPERTLSALRGGAGTETEAIRSNDDDKRYFPSAPLRLCERDCGRQRAGRWQ